MKLSPKEIFEYGLQYHHYANTAYPLTPVSFKEFKLAKEADYINFLKKEWAKTEELSLYVHIPFCTHRCNFCEYAVLEKAEAYAEDEYLQLLLKEIAMYKQILNGKTIVGYDLGGGTPTKLSIPNLEIITHALTHSFTFKKEVVFSIETTPVIAAREPEKIQAIYTMGYHRISMGIQTVSERLLNELGREGTTHIYEQATANIRKAGFKMFNIDLMYGFLHQTNEDFEHTLRYAIGLQPDYITLYRNRYKGTKLENEAGGVSLYKIIRQYKLAYTLLNEHGYYANPGKNTFSKIKEDYGTSDYLTQRVIEGIPYVGMGLGAQSFGKDYLAYNQGAASKKLNQYKEKINEGKLPIQDIYSLNKEESIAKMVSVAFYFGFIDLAAFQKRFKISFTEYFSQEIDFLINEGLMEMQEKRIALTPRGADYINGVIPLFYSDKSKKELVTLYKKSKTPIDGEAEFLKAYHIKEYERPSLAADIVVLSAQKNRTKEAIAKHKDLSVVLIKRGEHPYMNAWALPGGFVRPSESVEQAAYRELREEAGISDVLLTQLHVFSEPERDPRGWIVSCAFTAFLEEAPKMQFGDDAIDTRLFEISTIKNQLENKSDNQGVSTEEIQISLTNDTISLSATVEKRTVQMQGGDEKTYKIIESDGIAFDHSKIILLAIEQTTGK